MSDPTGDISISDDLKQKFPDLIALILGSQSMNTEERQYWINILPIMTPEQIQNLRDILENEKKQLAAIDKKYASAQDASSETNIAETAISRQERRSELSEKEAQFEKKEEEETEDLLRRIQDL